MKLYYPYRKEIKTIAQAQDMIFNMCDDCKRINECNGGNAAICNKLKEKLQEIFKGLDTVKKERITFGYAPGSFLSNSYPSKINHMGFTFQSVEAAYQASKCMTAEETGEFSCIDAREARYMGDEAFLREDWEDVKVSIMKELLILKFSDVELMRQLIETGNAELAFEGPKVSRFWGCRNGKGKNVLGKLLMEIRDELRLFLGLDGVMEEKEDILKREFLLVEIKDPDTCVSHYFITDCGYDTGECAVDVAKDSKHRPFAFQSFIRENGHIIKDLGTEMPSMILPDISGE